MINCINYSFTTHCNMKCPNCCAGITALPKSMKSFYSWDYYVNSAVYFKGVKRINLTGGEPSVHPKFEEFVPKFKELFECESLTVWTNGTMFRKKPEVWQHFDQIHITNYTKDTFVGSPDNTSEIEFIRELYPNKEIYSAKVIHDDLSKRGTKMCFRGHSDTVEFVDGMIYPCSSSSGLPTKKNIPLCENWREEIFKIYPPCNECLFAEN